MFFKRAIEVLALTAFASTGVALMLLSFGLVASGGIQLVLALRQSMEETGDALLDAVGYVVVAIAVFDVAKYFLDDRVLHASSRRLLDERRSTIKLIHTVCIAVFIEGLVLVFQVAKNSEPSIAHPVAFLGIAILVLLGLGVYQKLNARAEQQLEQEDEIAEREA